VTISEDYFMPKLPNIFRNFYLNSERGIIPLVIPVVAVAAIGVLSFILVTATGPFKNDQLSSLYPKQPTEAKSNNGNGGNGNGNNGQHGKPSVTPNPTTTTTPKPTSAPTPPPTVKPTATPVPTKTPSGVTISMSPTTGSITGGSSLTENVNIFTASQQVSAAEIHITFDPSKVHVSSITAGTALPVVLVAGTFDNSAGTASITLGSQPTSPLSGSGTLATVNFTGIANGTANVGFASTTMTASVGKTGNSLSSSSGSSITVSGL
jgi:hypothetical protein